MSDSEGTLLAFGIVLLVGGIALVVALPFNRVTNMAFWGGVCIANAWSALLWFLR